MRLLGVLLIFRAVLGVHFDYATISWRQLSGTPTTARKYEFTLIQGFETNFPGNHYTHLPYPKPGEQVDWDHPNVPGTAGLFHFTPMPPTATDLTHDVSSTLCFQENILPTEGWLLSKIVWNVTISGSFTSNWAWNVNDGLRHNPSLDNNGNIDYRLTGVVNRFDTESIPARGGVPNVKLDLNKFNLYLVAVVNPDNDPLFFTFSKLSESDLATAIPTTAGSGSGGVFSADDFTDHQFRLNTRTGLVSWWPATAGVYSVQFMIEKDCAAEGNSQAICTDSKQQPNCCSRTVLDILFKVVNPDPSAPSFVAPFPSGSGTAANPNDPTKRTVTVFEGVPFTLPLVSDVPGGVGVLIYSDLPDGMTISNGTSDPNGTAFTISWPDPEGDDAWVCFKVYNPTTNTSSHGQYCILFKVRVQITLAVDNLPKISGRPGLWALPSKPGFADVIRLRQSQKNSKWYPGIFHIQHRNGQGTGTGYTTQGTPTFDNSDKNQTFTISVPWDIPDLANWIHNTKITWGPTGRWVGGDFEFNTVFHLYASTGRFVVPASIAAKAAFTLYDNNWESDNGYTVFTPDGGSPPTTQKFYGFTIFNSSFYVCDYTQSLKNQANGKIESYLHMGAPVLPAQNQRIKPYTSGDPKWTVSNFAIYTISGAPDNSVYLLPNAGANPDSPPVRAVLYGTYCINNTKFKTFR